MADLPIEDRNQNVIYDLDLIKDNPNTRVIIDMGTNDPSDDVIGFLTNELSFQGSNQWTSSFENLAGGTVQKVNDAINLGNNFKDDKFANYQLQSKAQTLYSWSGSGRVSFTIELLFIAGKKR